MESNNNDFEKYLYQLAEVLRECDSKQLAAISLMLSQLSCMVSAVSTEKLLKRLEGTKDA